MPHDAISFMGIFHHLNVMKKIMPTPAYMSITGERQGLITANNFTEPSVGNIYQEGHEDETLIQAFTHKILLPRDPQPGQPTGQRVHTPMQITKVMDKSSPLLYRALTSGERLPKVETRIFPPTSARTPASR